MTAVPFDTLKLARKLRENAGFTAEHAEAAAEALSESIGEATASKGDLELQSRDLKLWFGRMLAWQTGVLIAVMGLIAAYAKLVGC